MYIFISFARNLIQENDEISSTMTNLHFGGCVGSFELKMKNLITFFLITHRLFMDIIDRLFKPFEHKLHFLLKLYNVIILL